MTARNRAERGTGSIKQRANGRWAWSIEFKDKVTKEPVRLDRERKTREEALEAGRQALIDHDAAEKIAPAPLPGTVADWYSHWLRLVLARTDGSPNTYVNYEGHVRRRIIPALGDIMMSELKTEDVTRMLDTIPGQPTRYEVRKAMSRGWKEAVEAGKATDYDLIRRTPVKRQVTENLTVAKATSKAAAEAEFLANIAKPPALHLQSMSDEDQTRIWATLETERMRARFILGLVYGPRQSEVLGLVWPALTRPSRGEQGWIDVDKTRIRDWYAHGCSELKPCPADVTPQRCPFRVFLNPFKGTKTVGSERSLYLGDGVVELLLDWEGKQILELASVPNPPVIPWMFTQKNGAPYSHSVDAKLWQQILKRAKVSRHYSLHDLRRTAASEAAADRSIDAVTMRGMFGWTKQSTADLYIKPQAKRLKDAFRKQDDRMATDPKTRADREAKMRNGGRESD